MKFLKIIAVVSTGILLSVNVYANDEINPKNKTEFARLILECYSENFSKKWQRLGYLYQRVGKDESGKSVVNISANLLDKNDKWKIAEPCHPLAPAVIAERFMKNTGNYERKFENLSLVVFPDGKFQVYFDGSIE